MRVRYTPRARGDIESIWHYLSERSPSGAVNVVKAIYAGVQFIADYPEASQRADGPAIRVRVVRRYRYKIFYRIIKTVSKYYTYVTRRGDRGYVKDDQCTFAACACTLAKRSLEPCTASR
jgi:plasmid stabilization system protein ParE